MYSMALITTCRYKVIPYPTSWGRGGMTAACWVQLHGAHLLWEKCGLSVRT